MSFAGLHPHLHIVLYCVGLGCIVVHIHIQASTPTSTAKALTPPARLAPSHHDPSHASPGIVLADTRIHILGSFQNIRVARDAICALIMGSPPGKVYSKLRSVCARLNDS